ncbi:NAD(P)-binding domain-containing protein [Micromonospora sp. NPDC051296]|uniref:NADPH-dependent F420 reductase n=1 Tax=Micromonospora sp. NPDC051296 TaxID=3155046 RepID=UPI003449CE5E
MIVGILGRGRMGSALARALAVHGQSVLIAGRTHAVRQPPVLASHSEIHCVPASTVVAGADLLVLMLPFAAAVELALDGLLDDGRGRTVIDATNPPQSPVEPAGRGRSGGRLLAELLPRWRVVKALNTVPAGMLGEPVLGGRAVTVPLAGDHPPAKIESAGLLRGLGFVPVDVGGIDRAPALESLAELLMAIDNQHALRGRLGFCLALPDQAAMAQTSTTWGGRAPGPAAERQRLAPPAAESIRSPLGRPPRPSR